MSVFYRKYRSKSLDELVGQDHIVNALRNSIKQNKIAHAYLLTGPRGTGKTSVARIIAYSVNDIPYDETKMELDIIEIDAASNRRIDEIRDLRDKVHIAPTSLKYKVYIIDEVHMLTKEAFNALLKTLEEPPEHVIFILATTELHKVPDTIVSRTQRFAFKPIAADDIVKHLAYIAKEESIKHDEAGLRAIADHADGGFRDAINLLDQVRHLSDEVTEQTVLDALGVPPIEALEQLWQNLRAKRQEATVGLIALLDQGYHAPLIAKSLLRRAIDDQDASSAHMFLECTSGQDARIRLELAVLGLVAGDRLPTSKPVPIATTKPAEPKPEPIKVQPSPTQKTQPTSKEAPVPEANQSEGDPPKASDNLWQKVLESIKQNGHSIYGPLRLATAKVHDGSIILGLAFPFHIKRVTDPANMSVLLQTVEEVAGKRHDITVEKIKPVVDQEPAPVNKKQSRPEPIPEEPTIIDDPLPEPLNPDDPLSLVKNVFGSAEIL